MSPKGYIRLHVGVGLEEYIKKLHCNTRGAGGEVKLNQQYHIK